MRKYTRKTIAYETTDTGCLICTSHKPRSGHGSPVTTSSNHIQRPGWVSVVSYLYELAGKTWSGVLTNDCFYRECINPLHHREAPNAQSLPPALVGQIVQAQSLEEADRIARANPRWSKDLALKLRRRAGVAQRLLISVPGSELLAARVAAGITQQELASAMGVDHSNVSYQEIRGCTTAAAARTKKALESLTPHQGRSRIGSWRSISKSDITGPELKEQRIAKRVAAGTLASAGGWNQASSVYNIERHIDLLRIPVVERYLAALERCEPNDPNFVNHIGRRKKAPLYCLWCGSTLEFVSNTPRGTRLKCRACGSAEPYASGRWAARKAHQMSKRKECEQ